MIEFIASEYRKTRDIFDSLLVDNKFQQLILKISQLCVSALNNDGKIIFCGNGGSSADAEHLAAELSGRLYYDRPALNAISLASCGSALTAISNDYGYQYSFSRQIEAFGRKGDVLIVFSTSGRSLNVIEAVQSAQKKGISTVGFLGRNGREIGNLVDYSLNIPADETPKIQEAHIATGHILCALIEEIMFGAEYNKSKAGKVVTI